MSPVEALATQIDAALRALPDHSVAALRKVRRRWSATLKQESAEAMLALAIELFERFDHRWIAYELLLFHPSALTLVDQISSSGWPARWPRGATSTSSGACWPARPGGPAGSTTPRSMPGRGVRIAGGGGRRWSPRCR